jgi:hypothetical protein
LPDAELREYGIGLWRGPNIDVLLSRLAGALLVFFLGRRDGNLVAVARGLVARRATFRHYGEASPSHRE